MKNTPPSKKELPHSGKPNSHIPPVIEPGDEEGNDKNDDNFSNNSDLNSSPDKSSLRDLKSSIKILENELAKKESEIDFLKEKLTNNQGILLDIIEDKKSLKKQVQDFELKEIDDRLNNFRDLQRKQHKIEHRLFVTKNNLDEARQELEVREKVIKDLEKRGLMDYVLANYPKSYVQYQKNRKD